MTKTKINGMWVTTSSGEQMWTGTKAQLAAGLADGTIPEGTKVMVTNDYDEQNVYTEEEQMIGKWIDGKPLYRKMYKKLLTKEYFSSVYPADPDNITGIVTGNIDFDTADNIKLDTLVNVGGVVKDQSNGQQWLITPGIGHQSIIRTVDPTFTIVYVQKIATIIRSVDKFIRFHLLQSELNLADFDEGGNYYGKGFDVTAYIEYTKTSD